jgi:outer membrane protein assembly factor BamB
VGPAKINGDDASVKASRGTARLGSIAICGLVAGIAAATWKEGMVPWGRARADSVVAAVEMLPPERVLGSIGITSRMGAVTLTSSGERRSGSYAYPERFTWSSDRPDVVTVDQRGMVTSVGEGTASITARSDGVSGRAAVTVRDAVHLAWSLPLGASPDAGVAVAADGTIYVAAGSTLRALDPGGQLRWSAHTGGIARSTPAIAPDGTIYLATDDRDASLLAFDPAGRTRWSKGALGRILSSPAVARDGTVYVASGDSTLYAIDEMGQRRWAFKARGAFHFSSPALAADETIIVGAEDGRLYAVTPDGRERWTYPAAGRIWSSPAIAIDGTIYFGSHDGHIYALTANGDHRWSVDLGEEVWSSPAIGADGTIYLGARGIHALDPTGRRKWSFEGAFPSTRVVSTPLVAANGSIYFSGSDGRVWALNVDGSPKWDYQTRSRLFASPAIGLDGTVYGASYDSTLYAISERGPGNGGYANAPWPKARGNRANAGRARAW